MPDGPAPGPSRVELVPVEDTVLDRLVAAAVAGASAGEVTAPLTAGEGWSPGRVDWLRTFHRERRGGLAGPCREATWAVVVDGGVAGSVRLRQVDQPGVVETGIWLCRAARGRGVGAGALAAVVRTAAALGYAELRAETTRGNRPASAVLAAAGFALDPPTGTGVVVARLLMSGPRRAGG